MQKSAEIETKVQEKTSKSQHYKIASMGDGVDDWLILTAIQKSLIHYISFYYNLSGFVSIVYGT